MASVPRREANLIPLTTGYFKLAFALENTFKDANLGSKNLVGPLDLKKKYFISEFFKKKNYMLVQHCLKNKCLPSKND